jgi:hypothetical protein
MPTTQGVCSTCEEYRLLALVLPGTYTQSYLAILEPMPIDALTQQPARAQCSLSVHMHHACTCRALCTRTHRLVRTFGRLTIPVYKLPISHKCLQGIWGRGRIRNEVAERSLVIVAGSARAIKLTVLGEGRWNNQSTQNM